MVFCGSIHCEKLAQLFGLPGRPAANRIPKYCVPAGTTTLPFKSTTSALFFVMYSGWRGSFIPDIKVTRLALNPQSPQLNISHISFSRLLSITISVFTVANVLAAASVATCFKSIPASFISASRLERRRAIRNFKVLATFTHNCVSALHQLSKVASVVFSASDIAWISVIALSRSLNIATNNSC